MYGISNSQQGGGGGSAASYKAIKSTITPSDWQEVAKQPYFVGSNVTEWPIDDEFGMPAKRSETVIGLITGEDYTISATIDGQVYTKTAQAFNPSGAMKALLFYFAGVGDELIALQIMDAPDMVPGFNSFALINAPATVTSYTITSFSGPGLDFGSSDKVTISDSAIKVNSAVTVYVNTSEKIEVGEKTDGSVILTVPSIPTADIPYSLEIVGTDSEGLFELVNGYVLDISDIPYVPSVPTKTSDLQNDSGFLTKDNFVAGDNITITNENDNLIISATGGASSELVTTLKGTEIIKTFDNLDGCELIKGDTADGYIYC